MIIMLTVYVLISHTTKSVTDLSFSASVLAVPNNSSSHICKSDSLTKTNI